MLAAVLFHDLVLIVERHVIDLVLFLVLGSWVCLSGYPFEMGEVCDHRFLERYIYCLVLWRH